MPQILRTLDEIAREKQRDVLCVMFFDPRQGFPKNLSAAKRKLRSALIQFLDGHSISWSECFDPGSDNLMFYSYCGSLYLDVPYDLADPAYRLVADYLETPDGEPKYKDMHFGVRTWMLRSRTPTADWIPRIGRRIERIGLSLRLLDGEKARVSAVPLTR